MGYNAVGTEAWYTLNMRECQRFECHNEVKALDKRTKYCSKSCATTVNNTNREYKYDCLNCHLPIPHGKQFCTRKCGKLYRLKDWIEGRTDASESSGALSKSAREYLIEHAGNQCTECGWKTPNPVLGRPILTVDHKDGNWTNNYIDNLIVLCYNCHTLTENFGALNKGSASGTRPNGLSRKR